MTPNRQVFIVLPITAVVLLIAVLGLQMPENNWITVILAIMATAVLGYLMVWQKYFLVLILMALIPFSHDVEIPGIGFAISLPVELLLVALSFFLIKPLVIKQGKWLLSHPLSILLLIDLAWLVLTSVTSSDHLVSAKRVFMRCLFLLFGYFFMLQWFKDKRALLKPFFMYALGFIPVILAILITHSRHGFVSQISFYVTKPYYDEHTVYAACLAFIVPIVLYATKRTRLISKDPGSKMVISLVFLVFLAALVLSYSRAAWLSLIVGLGVYMTLRVRLRPIYYASGVLGLLLCAFIFQGQIERTLKGTEAVSNDGDVANHVTSVTNVSTDASNLERINRWVCAIRMFEEKPILGFGPGTYQFEYAQFQTAEYTTRISTKSGDKGNAHSEYLMALSETGLPGFLSFLILVIYTVYLGIRNNLRGEGYLREVNNVLLVSLVTFFFHGIFNSFIDQDKMALLLYPAMAAIAAISGHISTEKALKASTEPQ